MPSSHWRVGAAGPGGAALPSPEELHEAVRGPSQAELPPLQTAFDAVLPFRASAIPVEQAPELYRAVGAVTHDLLAAYRKLYPSSPVPRLVLADSPVANAVMLKRPPDAPLLTLTTGWLKLFMTEGTPPAELSARLVTALSVGAHELGHATSDSFHQKEEARADAIGARLLEEANYPIDALYEAFERLGTPTRPASRGRAVLDAMAASHPPTDLRQSAQRIHLTLARVERGARGELPAWTQQIDFRPVLDELEAQNLFHERWDFQWPQSIGEAVKRLEAEFSQRRSEPDGDGLHAREFQALVIALDQLIARAGPELTPHDEQQALEWFETWTRNEQPYFWKFPWNPLHNKELVGRMTAADGRAEFGRREGSPSVPRFPGHDLQVARLPFYRERVAQWLRPRLDLDQPEHRYGMVSALARADAHYFLSPATLMDAFGPELVAEAKRKGPLSNWSVTNEDNVSLRSEIESVTGSLNQADATQLASEMALRSYLERGEPKHELYTLFHFLEKADIAAVWRREAGAGRPAAAEHLATYHRLAQELWDHRGAVAVVGLTGRLPIASELTTVIPGWRDKKVNDALDLRRVADELGIPPTTVASSIRGSARDFITGRVDPRSGQPAVQGLAGESFADAMRATYETELATVDAQPDWLKDDYLKLQQQGASDQALVTRVLDKPPYFKTIERKEGAAFFWLDAAFPRVLLGASTRLSAASEGLPARRLGQQLLGLFPEQLEALYREHWARGLRETRDPKALQVFIEQQLLPRPHEPGQLLALSRSLVQAVEASGLSAADQAAILDHYMMHQGEYLSSGGLPADVVGKLRSWPTLDSVTGRAEHLEVVQRHGLSADALTFAEGLSDDMLFKLDALSGLAPHVDDLVSRAPSRDLVFRAARLFEPTMRAAYQSRLHNEFPQLNQIRTSHCPFSGAFVKDLSATLLAWASRDDVAPADRRELWELMSTAGGSRELDAFFERHLEPGLKGDLLTLQRLLNEGRFSTGKLRLRLTREAMAPWASALEREAEKLAGRGPLPEHHLEQVEAFLDEFQRLSPGASTARDAQLEAYGWAFGLSGEPLKKLVEDRKSTQLENIHAVAINGASALEDYFAHLGRPQRVEMIKFLMNADSARLPDFVDADLDRYAEAVAPPKPETPDDHRGQAAVKASLEASLLGLVNEKSPIERIPLFESLMTAGVDRLTTHPESMERLFAECLGLAPKSREAALLRAYLDVTPAYEATVTLSFIIAQRCEEGESEDPGAATRALFEAFGIAGKKTGQKASVMNLFGDEVSAATAEFKNRARPMTRVQVMEALEESLTDAEKKQIKRCVRVLGSASLKTAVEVELVDGRRVALLIQPHQSAALISENIELGKAYIARLREEPELDLPVAMLENLVLSLEEELHAEQRFSVEVSRSKRAAAVVEALNHDMAPELDGWKLTVPQPVDGFEVRDELMFVDLAEGRTWDQLTKPEREKAGPLLVSAALKMLFEHGEFDPDRHLGNWLFKLDSMNAGEIQMLDVAELDSFSKSRRPFQSDELFTLSRALQGVEKKDARLLAQLGPQMARPGQPVKDPARLERELAEALKGSDDFSATMVKVLSTWADHGIYLQKKFFLGGFNGLMILMREHYVPEQAFFELIEGHVRSTVKRKLPTVLGQEIRQLWR